MRAVDVHTHAFPDFLADRAIQAIQEKAVLQRAYLDGSVADLVRSMDRAGIDKSVVACIATVPDQFENIFRWCGEIRSDRIVPFPSVHPFSDHAADEVERIADAGYRGVKLHPLYQDFDPLDDRAVALYGAVADAGLVLLFHSGDDLRFLGDHRCAPRRMLEIKARVPDLTMILSHLGGFWQSTEFVRHGLGSDVYIETSHTIPSEPSETFTRICHEHAGRVMFGTDSPWQDQEAEIEKLRHVIDDEQMLEDILWNNAAKLLGLESNHG
ncbi:MAG: amidohydrolase family protein [Planctomycetota bacterium]